MSTADTSRDIQTPREASSRLPAAVLFDMDGTLVDTEPYWIETEFALAAEYDAEWTREDALRLVGNDLLVSGAYIKDRMRLEMSPGEVVERLLDGVVARVRRSVPWQPGARELLTALRAERVPCALVTMSYMRFVEPILAHLPPDAFEVIVTGDRVDNGKPHPEPYQKAAAALGLAPADCVAIEDSGTGATSAEVAGCTVLVVPSHVEVAPGERRFFRETLEGLTPADLGRL